MRRRDFIKGIVGSAAAWPLVARAQQRERMRRIGVLMNRAADDPEGQSRVAVFQRELKRFGWSDGDNVRFDIRWGADEVERERSGAAELLALAPDVVFASGTLSVAALRHTGRSLPIVFVGVTDPVGASFVDSLARPGGDITGFMIYEYSFGGKRLELLKQIAPNVTRAAVLRDSSNPAGTAEFAAIQALDQTLGVETRPVDSGREMAEVERAVSNFAQSANGGLIVTPNAAVSVRRDMLIALTAKHKLPAVYPFRYMVTAGGLISIGPDLLEQCRLAASYVDRILKGEKAANLPVQAPTKYETAVNLKTAKALGLTVPPGLLASADEVIE